MSYSYTANSRIARLSYSYHRYSLRTDSLGKTKQVSHIYLLSPWEESAKPSLLGVHLILLYFISISLLIPRIFVLFSGGWGVVGGGCPTVFSLNLLIIIWYRLKVYMYMCAKGIRAEQKSYGF